ATLPEAVLQQAQAELLDWHGIGASIMEISHRGKHFTEVIAAAEADLRELLAIPNHYKVLFLQGGATLQFSQIPMNLLAGRSADYVITGSWSKKAYEVAGKIGKVRLAVDAASGLPDVSKLETNAPDTGNSGTFDDTAAYLHLCTNETIHGVEIFEVEQALHRLAPPAVPLVADMSSHILSRPIDVSRYGLIYAGAQKNIGPSGMTLVIIREDLLGHTPANVPALLDYQVQADNDSMLNTPTTFSIYMARLVFKWLKAQGGLSAIETINKEKSALVYAAIDGSGGFYKNSVDKHCRSRMNVPFNLPTPELETQFWQEADRAGFMGLKGHKSVGGIRASLYNALPLQGAQALVDFMNDFAFRHNKAGLIRSTQPTR
ncbi:MAG: 3-phosphoserine/phosphohydroxythreonine transaminase, partial [Zoogloeaceae bacterium]|nr:3-phosphoserine/phosphohydroxythreonine transaminase [Zoogloeaceae bacterium]